MGARGREPRRALGTSAMDKIEAKIHQEQTDRIADMTVAISKAHDRARAVLSDGVEDAFEALEAICDLLDPYSRKPF